MNTSVNLIPVSPSEIDWDLRMDVFILNDSEYTIRERKGDFWYPLLSFKESEIASVVASGALDNFPEEKKRLIKLAKLDARHPSPQVLEGAENV